MCQTFERGTVHVDIETVVELEIDWQSVTTRDQSVTGLAT